MTIKQIQDKATSAVKSPEVKALSAIALLTVGVNVLWHISPAFRKIFE